MDFAFNEEQNAIRDLAADIFAGKSGIDRVKAVEATDERIDRELWRELILAGLVGIALPEEFGGGGMGLTELCVLLEQQGRNVAPVPLWETALAAAAVAEFGSQQQKHAYVAPAAAGDLLLTAGLEEFGPLDPTAPKTVADKAADGTWTLTGAKAVVPAAHVAARVVVSAATQSGTGLFLVDPAGAGVRAENNETTTRAIRCRADRCRCRRRSVRGDRAEALWDSSCRAGCPRDGPRRIAGRVRVRAAARWTAPSARARCRPRIPAAQGRCRSCRTHDPAGRSRRATACGDSSPSRTRRASLPGAAATGGDVPRHLPKNRSFCAAAQHH